MLPIRAHDARCPGDRNIFPFAFRPVGAVAIDADVTDAPRRVVFLVVHEILQDFSSYLFLVLFFSLKYSIIASIASATFSA